MENKSLNIFNSRLVLATPDTATDGDFARIEGGWWVAWGNGKGGAMAVPLTVPCCAPPTVSPPGCTCASSTQSKFSFSLSSLYPCLHPPPWAGVVGHEYFHNWTGNRVTCRDWFQLTLKEGLTVYRDQVSDAAGSTCSTCNSTVFSDQCEQR
jgi:hypothetical protein